MKKRKTFTGMAIFIAILILGVGYAAVSDISLNLTGTANVKANAEFSVEFDTGHTVVVTPNDTKVTWDQDDLRDVVVGKYTDDLNATMTVNLDSTHRTASAIYKIDNNSADLKATVTAAVTTDFADANADYLGVTTELYSDVDCETELNNTELAPGDSAYLKVTVSLTKLPVNDITNAQFNITTTAKPVEVTLGN